MDKYLFIAILLASYALTFIFLSKRLVNLYRRIYLRDTGDSKTDLISESFFIYIFPGLGLYMTSDPCSERPFALESIPTAVSCWLIFAVAHACSKYYKQKLSPAVLVVITAALIFGIVFCSVLCVHFSSATFLVLMPVLNVLYLSPLFCLFYLLREVYNLNLFLRSVSSERNQSGSESLNAFYKALEHSHLGFALYLFAPLTALLQAVLFLFGQRPDSLICQFTDSCGFLLSYTQGCSCGGDHYLCSIAANGSRKLVKPVRMGLRKNEKIFVNRQLLIANAFEDWLEEEMPGLHRKIRRTYDNCNIPVNAWSKHKKIANFIYIAMKPLEWLFLAWLYLFDTRPEDRIAKQYLPKQELNLYITKKHRS